MSGSVSASVSECERPATAVCVRCWRSLPFRPRGGFGHRIPGRCPGPEDAPEAGRRPGAPPRLPAPRLPLPGLGDPDTRLASGPAPRRTLGSPPRRAASVGRAHMPLGLGGDRLVEGPPRRSFPLGPGVGFSGAEASVGFWRVHRSSLQAGRACVPAGGCGGWAASAGSLRAVRAPRDSPPHLGRPSSDLSFQMVRSGLP